MTIPKTCHIDGDRWILTLALQLFLDVGAQVVNIKARRVHHNVGQAADGLQRLAFLKYALRDGINLP